MVKILLIILAIIWPFNPGKPAKDVLVAIENSRSREPVAWQVTGDKGKVSIAHLDDNDYQLVMEFPQLEGKWINTSKRHRVLTKATYNPKNKTYYYQGEEGYFSVKFFRTKRINNEDFNPVFREIREDGYFRYVIAWFTSHRNGAEISVQVKKLKASQFKRKVEKIDHDISALSILRVD